MRLNIWQSTILVLLVVGLYGVFCISGIYGIASTYGKAGFEPKRLCLHSVSMFGLVAILLLGPFFSSLTHELGHVVASKGGGVGRGTRQGGGSGNCLPGAPIYRFMSD
jgi:hypothetical protein